MQAEPPPAGLDDLVQWLSARRTNVMSCALLWCSFGNAVDRQFLFAAGAPCHALNQEIVDHIVGTLPPRLQKRLCLRDMPAAFAQQLAAFYAIQVGMKRRCHHAFCITPPPTARRA
jgi:hypothetical protein